MVSVRKIIAILAVAVCVFGCGSNDPEPKSNIVKPGDPGYLKGDGATDAGPAKGSAEATGE
ncbi:MAG: hypothetical protein SFX74_04035 [Fimbriimonadaceae bacterium]|nr:hypothetical protein [Fimbriimonadaceae bacterium]